MKGLSDKPSGVHARGGDTAKQKQLGFQYRVGFQAGVERALDYYSGQSGDFSGHVRTGRAAFPASHTRVLTTHINFVIGKVPPTARSCGSGKRHWQASLKGPNGDRGPSEWSVTGLSRNRPGGPLTRFQDEAFLKVRIANYEVQQ